LALLEAHRSCGGREWHVAVHAHCHAHPWGHVHWPVVIFVFVFIVVLVVDGTGPVNDLAEL
jgi:hypothetical protein